MINDDPLPPLLWHNTPAPDIDSVAWLGEGDFCTSYLANGTHVVRLAKHAEASSSLRREMRLLPKLEAMLGVSIPHIEGVGVRGDTGEGFIYYPLVPGVALDLDAVASCDPACRSALMRQLAHCVEEMQRFPIEVARSCGLEERDPRRYLPELIAHAERAFASDLEPSVWRYYRSLVELYLGTPELSVYTPALLHGDLSPDHLLGDIEGCRLTGVIDFGDCMIGDAYRDLIFILEDYGDDIFDLFLSFYAPDDTATASRRVYLFQQLNNVEHCMVMFARGDRAGFDEALETLATDARSQQII